MTNFLVNAFMVIFLLYLGTAFITALYRDYRAYREYQEQQKRMEHFKSLYRVWSK